METKAEFQSRERAWLAALSKALPSQRTEVLRLFNEERLAHGLKAIHQ